jgi:anti-sigma-K factor RskA
MADQPHDLTAAYALDALDEADTELYEEHLRTCEPCRSELASLRSAAAALAHVAPAAAPPPELRAQILEQARSERPNVRPLVRRRVLGPAVAAVAVACAIAALAVWATSLHHDLDRRNQLLAVLADPSAQHVALKGAPGTLVVRRNGDAALITALPPAPSGKTYQLWVIKDGTPKSAGLYGGGRSVLVHGRVAPGTTVAVTVERAGGADAPTTKPILSASA